MRGSRVKALRTERAAVRPGRKHGGTHTKVEAIPQDERIAVSTNKFLGTQVDRRTFGEVIADRMAEMRAKREQQRLTRREREAVGAVADALDLPIAEEFITHEQLAQSLQASQEADANSSFVDKPKAKRELTPEQREAKNAKVRAARAAKRSAGT